MRPALLLNIDYTPLDIVGWRVAVEKVLMDKVDCVEVYEDVWIRSPSLQIQLPAVIRLRTKYVRRRIVLNKKNILARDGFTCQYCGARATTIDHVIPRAQSIGGKVRDKGLWKPVSGWENLVAACDHCNHNKADRTPLEAGLTLNTRPRVPSPQDMVQMHLSVLERANRPREWEAYFKL